MGANLKRSKIIEVKFGSHLYGTDTENSDLDLKSVFIPTKEELLSRNHPRTIQDKRPKKHGEKNTKDDVDIEMISLDRFMELLLEGQTVALDMLFAPLENFTEDGLTAYNGPEGKIWKEIVENKERFLSRNVTAFVGYARKQAAKYGVKGSRIAAVREVLNLFKQLPPHSKVGEHEAAIDALVESTKEYISMEKTPLIEVVELPAHKDGPLAKYLSCCGRKVQFSNKVIDAIKVYQRVFDEYGTRALQAESNKGVDFKALSHAVRVNSEAIELLSTGKITLPLPNRELILKIKKGEIPYNDIAHMIETGLMDLEEARKNSTLRETPDKEWADQFVANIYRKVCGEWPLKAPLLERMGLANLMNPRSWVQRKLRKAYYTLKQLALAK